MISNGRVLGINLKRRATRRRVVVVFWFFTLLSSVLLFRHEVRDGLGGMSALLLVGNVVNLTFFLGGVHIGGAVKPFKGLYYSSLTDQDDPVRGPFATKRIFARGFTSPDMDLDERESRLRDRAHFIAYSFNRWLALVLFAIYALLCSLQVNWLIRTGPSFFFLLAVTLWSLPQTLILWYEPDVEVMR